MLLGDAGYCSVVESWEDLNLSLAIRQIVSTIKRLFWISYFIMLLDKN